MKRFDLRSLLSFWILTGLLPFAAQAQDATWNTSPGSSDWNTSGNWTPATVPTNNATFATSNTTAVTISASTAINNIIFNSGASAFTITAGPVFGLSINGFGITNNSGITQNFVNSVDNSGDLGAIVFNIGSAGSMTAFTNSGGAISGAAGAFTQFLNSSTAGSATFNNNAGTASGAFGGRTEFELNSTANNAIINNNGGAFAGSGGETIFQDNVIAGSPTINNNAGTNALGGGFTVFNNNASASSATINNNAGVGDGSTIFNDHSSSGNAIINNNVGAAAGQEGAVTSFNDSSTAGGTINNNGATVDGNRGGLTTFADTSTALVVTINNNASPATGPLTSGGFAGGGGETDFENNSTAEFATINNSGATVAGNGFGKTNFFDASTAGFATINNNGGTVAGAGGGSTQFDANSSAGSSVINVSGSTANGAGAGTLAFNNNASASTALITATGGTTGGALGGVINFNDTSTAATSVITAGPGTGGANGAVFFNDSATADHAKITLQGAIFGLGGFVRFSDTSAAESAQLIADAGTGSFSGGAIQFIQSTTADNTAITVNGDGTGSNANGQLDISPHNGDLQIGSLSGGGNVFLGANTLIIGSNNSSTEFSGVITDLGGGILTSGGGVTLIGGTLILSGANTYPGDTNVNGGILQLDGSITSNTFVSPDGELTGLGQIFGNLTNNGIVSPRTFAGTLTVSGNYTQNSGSFLMIDVAGLATHDLLAVGGTASLGGALEIIPRGIFSLPVGDKIIIISAGGGVNGQFADIINGFDSQTLITSEVVYEANDVALLFTQGSFLIGGLTPNQTAVATNLNNSVGDPRADSLINFLDTESLFRLPHDYDLIAPEEFAALYEISFSKAIVQNQNLQHRMDDIRAGSNGFSNGGLNMNTTGSPLPEPGLTLAYSNGKMIGVPDGNDKAPNVMAPAPENRWGVFATGSGDLVNVNGNDNAHGYDIAMGTVLVGVDYKVCDHFAIGLDGSYSGGRANLVDDGRIDYDGGQAGAYATVFGYKILGSVIHFDAGVSGGLNDYDTWRTGLQNMRVRGSTDGSEFNAFAAYGGDWHFGRLLVGSWSSLQYTDVNVNSFTETGSLAPLHFPDQDEDSIRSSSGLRLAYDASFGGTIFRPEIRAGWEHEYGDQAYPIDARFASGAGGIFTVHGPSIGRDSALVDAGFTILWNNRISTYLFYDGNLGRGNYDNNAVSGGLRLTF